VVKVIWQKAASQLHMDSSVVFAGWRQCAPHVTHANPSPKPKWHLNRFSHFSTAHGRVSSGMPMHVLSGKNCPFTRAIWIPSNTWVLNPNCISIGSAIFAQPMLEYSGTCPGMSFPLQIAPLHGRIWRFGPPSNMCFLEPTWAYNPNSISIDEQPFLQGWQLWRTDRQTTLLVCNNRPHLCT